jgi:polysaccharide biosynthesis/export protein
MNKKTNCFFLFAFAVIIGTSCTSTKKMIYFNDLENVKQATVLSSQQDNEQRIIKLYEVLSIHITSPTPDENAYKLFNVPNDFKIGRDEGVAGYQVDSEGFIVLPLIGQVKAAGLSRQQLKQNILKEIDDKRLLLDAMVDVRFSSYEVTVLGEVAKPAVISVGKEKITLLKALGSAGDITPFGRRDNVMVIREVDGKKNVTRLNLNSSTFLQSPYYYLQPNDVVYVETTSNRAASVDKTRLILPPILSAISVIVLVIDRITR